VTGPVSLIANDVHVTFRVYEDGPSALKQAFSNRKWKRTHRTIHAVRGVSFSLHEGETLGIIGSNGSGKSTLLSALTGLTPLDRGTIHAADRPRLLGVGAALRPALSGYRNIIIGGLAMGMRKQEIESRMADIVAFAELEEFIDLPMRTYSSGMRARLTFAIATSEIPRILLIDEALAVGDARFKERSAQRLETIRNAAGSVILVSHDVNEIQRSCDRALWLEKGTVRAEGPVEETIEQYLSATSLP